MSKEQLYGIDVHVGKVSGRFEMPTGMKVAVVMRVWDFPGVRVEESDEERGRNWVFQMTEEDLAAFSPVTVTLEAVTDTVPECVLASATVKVSLTQSHFTPVRLSDFFQTVLFDILPFQARLMHLGLPSRPPPLVSRPVLPRPCFYSEVCRLLVGDVVPQVPTPLSVPIPQAPLISPASKEPEPPALQEPPTPHDKSKRYVIYVPGPKKSWWKAAKGEQSPTTLPKKKKPKKKPRKASPPSLPPVGLVGNNNKKLSDMEATSVKEVAVELHVRKEASHEEHKKESTLMAEDGKHHPYQAMLQRLHQEILATYPTLRAGFAQWNTNSDRVLSKVEFTQGITNLNLCSTKWVADALPDVDVADAWISRPGLVTIEDKKGALLGYSFTRKTDGSVTGMHDAAPEAREDWVTRETCDKLYAHMDSDGSNSITLTEFLHMMERARGDATPAKGEHSPTSSVSSVRERKGLRVESIKKDLAGMEQRLQSGKSRREQEVIKAVAIRNLGELLRLEHGSIRAAFSLFNTNSRSGYQTLSEEEWGSISKFGLPATTVSILYKAITCDAAERLTLKQFKGSFEWLGKMARVTDSQEDLKAAFAAMKQSFNTSLANRCGAQGLVVQLKQEGLVLMEFIADKDWAGQNKAWIPESTLTVSTQKPV
eukprot:TRINITY_DN3336_c2_g2_i1.p1 TRINITY_DN3336_c2_g2~~TRINITY_DN3336_c2_g2_i1.p1  ORF type:complete len:674 (+),score=146.27 TRINITY_DN3336_c2_g2_i1:65-2023(+)